MRVLFATHSSEFMGAEHSLMDMLSGLDATKVEPLVLLGRRGPLVAKLDEQGIRHVMVPYLGNTISFSPLKPSWVKRVVNNAAVPQVARLLQRQRIDLVHSNSILADVGMRAARRAGVPYVCHIRDHGKADHGLEFIDPEGVARLVAGAERAIAISDSVRRQYEPSVGESWHQRLHRCARQSRPQKSCFGS